MATKTSEALSSFLNQVVEDQIEDKYILVPECEAVATVKDYTFLEGVGTSPDGETEQPWFILLINFELDSEEAREVTNRDDVLVSSNHFLRQNAQGGLDVRGNVQLGRFLKVLGVESAGRTAIQIFDDLAGRSCNAKVKHVVRRKDKEDVLDEEGNPVVDARITAISKL